MDARRVGRIHAVALCSLLIVRLRRTIQHPMPDPWIVTAPPVQPPWTPPDAVGAALHVLRMSGTFYCRSDLRGALGDARCPTTPGCLWFHVVTSGSARLSSAATRSSHSPASDVVLLPRGEGHVMRSVDPAPLARADVRRSRTLARRPLRDDPHGGDGAPHHHDLRRRPARAPDGRALVALMPDLVHVPVSPLTARLHDTLRLIALEVEADRPGGEAVITRLADVLVVQMLRAWLAHDPAARTGGSARSPTPTSGARSPSST